MRIAQIAPLMETVPPRLYGGTERVVSYLTEQLVADGHSVTLFASGDSQTHAELVPICESAIRLHSAIRDPIPYYALMLDAVRRRAFDFDVLHFHIDCLHFPLLRALRTPAVTTLHGRLDLPELPKFYSEFREIALVSISDSQRSPLTMANWAATVHHGLPRNLLTPLDRVGDYVAFLGRISEEKRPDLAIEIAKRADVPLRIAAKVDRADLKYYEGHIKSLLDHPLIEFINEIGESQKNSFLGAARALLFPIDWPEPFGLVMIEAFACGTPVIAFRRGSVPEIIDDGVTGFIVDSVDEAVAALRRIDQLDRAAVRRRFEERFTSKHMAANYVNVYRQLLARKPKLSLLG